MAGYLNGENTLKTGAHQPFNITPAEFISREGSPSYDVFFLNAETYSHTLLFPPQRWRASPGFYLGVRHFLIWGMRYLVVSEETSFAGTGVERESWERAYSSWSLWFLVGSLFVFIFTLACFLHGGVLQYWWICCSLASGNLAMEFCYISFHLSSSNKGVSRDQVRRASVDIHLRARSFGYISMRYERTVNNGRRLLFRHEVQHPSKFPWGYLISLIQNATDTFLYAIQPNILDIAKRKRSQ